MGRIDSPQRATLDCSIAGGVAAATLAWVVRSEGVVSYNSLEDGQMKSLRLAILVVTLSAVSACQLMTEPHAVQIAPCKVVRVDTAWAFNQPVLIMKQYAKTPWCAIPGVK